MKTSHVIIGLAAILAGAIWTLSLAGRDERVIRKSFREAVQALEKSGPESPLAAAGRADTVAGVFVSHPDISLIADDRIPWPIPPTGSRAEIRSAVFHARATVDRLTLRVDDLSLQIRPDRAHATLSGTVRARAAVRGETGEMYQEFESDWIRLAEGWRVSAVRAVDAIRRPAAE